MDAGGLAERVGALAGPGPVEVVEDLTFSGRARVARIRFGDGATAIVKAPARSDAARREAEALRTFPAEVRPTVLAAGDGLLVMEDLGPGPSLADLLLGGDAAAAAQALEAWARTLGTIVRATVRPGRPEAWDDLAPGLAEMELLAGELGVAMPGGAADEARAITGMLSEPCPWVALCPSDTCPDNNRVMPDGTVRLFDFENAGWRHAATEAAYCRAPFCTCWCVARLPTGLRERMEAAFLDVLDPVDPDGFSGAVDLAATSYTLLSIPWFRRAVLEDRRVGPPGRQPTSARQYLYARLQAMSALDAHPALSTFAADVAAAIVARWPAAAELPRYPAFR